MISIKYLNKPPSELPHIEIISKDEFCKTIDTKDLSKVNIACLYNYYNTNINCRNNDKQSIFINKYQKSTDEALNFITKINKVIPTIDISLDKNWFYENDDIIIWTSPIKSIPDLKKNRSMPLYSIENNSSYCEFFLGFIGTKKGKFNLYYNRCSLEIETVTFNANEFKFAYANKAIIPKITSGWCPPIVNWQYDDMALNTGDFYAVCAYCKDESITNIFNNSITIYNQPNDKKHVFYQGLGDLYNKDYNINMLGSTYTITMI